MRQRLLWIDRLLSEPVMGFLALAAGALALVPFVFGLTPGQEQARDLIEWWIVGVFALEYLVRLALAPSIRAHMTTPARLLDLLIIVLPFFSLVPGVADAFRSSPLLRLLRLSRVAALGARSRSALLAAPAGGAAAARNPLEISMIDADRPGTARTISWEELCRHVREPSEEWFYLSGVYADHLPKIAEVLGLDAKLTESPIPRIEITQRFVTLFVWYPRTPSSAGGAPSFERTGTLIIGSQQNLVTLAREPRGLHREMAQVLEGMDAAAPFLVRVLYALLKHLLDRYGTVVDAIHTEIRRFEEVPVRHSTQQFLEETFALKRQIRAVHSDLFHFKEIARAVASNRIAVQGFDDPRHHQQLALLADEANYLFETAENLRDALLSLIELHINVSSFETNKVMRILAIVTTLALLPSVVGGLFGMNLIDNPWPLRLPEVAFCVGIGMALSLYVFAVKGWLR